MLGLVGYGQVGRRVALRALPFGMRVLAYDPYVEPLRTPASSRSTSLDELLARADFVSLHARATADNANLIDAAALAAMKPGAFLVNTAREALVDEDALDAALASGRLAGAALDVVQHGERAGPPPAAPPRERRAHPAPRRRDARDAPAGRRDDRRRDRAASPPASRSSTSSTGPRAPPAMSDELLLAIDAGTGSCRAVLFDRGRTPGRRSASASTPTRELPGVPGLAGLRHRRATGSLICACIREALAAAGATPTRVAGGQRHEHARGHGALRRARARDLGLPERRLARRRGGRRAGPLAAPRRRSTSRAGDWVAITAPARFLLDRAARAATSSPAIAHVGMLGDWILTRLSGEFVTDPSLGSSSGHVRPRRARLVGRACSSSAASTASVFPPVVEPGTVVGAVTAEAAAATGPAPQGTPVVAGGADTQLGLLGIGVDPAGPLHRRRRQLLAEHGRAR